MSKPIIRLGDKTTHGGTVVSFAPATMIEHMLAECNSERLAESKYYPGSHQTILHSLHYNE